MQKCVILIGLGFGDEGKGSIADWAVRHYNAKTVVRFNGGAQAAHNVITADGKHHTFSQFGSGTFAGADTFLSRHMLFDPIALIGEAKHLESLGIANPMSLITVDPEAVVVTPYHRAANRLKEIKRQSEEGGKHGSCGMGIGEAMSDFISNSWSVIKVKHLTKLDIEHRLNNVRELKLNQLQDIPLTDPAYKDEAAILLDPSTINEFVEAFLSVTREINIGNPLDQLIKDGHNIVFEGAQGVLIDEWHGFHPYTTWSTTTNANALGLLTENGIPNIEIKTVGVTRGYMVRHGPGPFPTESSLVANYLPDTHNCKNTWQGEVRAGWLDLVLLRYALATCKVNALAVTCLDRLDTLGDMLVCDRYSKADNYPVKITPDFQHNLDGQYQLGKMLSTFKTSYRTVDIDNLLEVIEKELETKVEVASYGPTAEDKVEL